MTAPGRAHEWRVTWRRDDWEPGTYDQVRYYQSEARARIRVRRLRHARGLSPLTFVRVDHRRVGPWQPDPAP